MKDMDNLSEVCLKRKKDLIDFNALLFEHDLAGIVSIRWETHKDLKKEGEFWLSMIAYFNIRGEIILNEEIKDNLVKLKENRFHRDKETVNKIILKNSISFLTQNGYF